MITKCVPSSLRSAGLEKQGFRLQPGQQKQKQQKPRNFLRMPPTRAQRSSKTRQCGVRGVECGVWSEKVARDPHVLHSPALPGVQGAQLGNQTAVVWAGVHAGLAQLGKHAHLLVLKQLQQRRIVLEHDTVVGHALRDEALQLRGSTRQRGTAHRRGRGYT